MGNESVEGLGLGQASPGVRQVIESGFKSLLVGQDPFNIEKLWNDMFWDVRGYGRKGVALCALSAVDIGLCDLKGQGPGAASLQAAGPLHRLGAHLWQRRLDQCFRGRARR